VKHQLLTLPISKTAMICEQPTSPTKQPNAPFAYLFLSIISPIYLQFSLFISQYTSLFISSKGVYSSFSFYKTSQNQKNEFGSVLNSKHIFQENIYKHSCSNPNPKIKCPSHIFLSQIQYAYFTVHTQQDSNFN